MDGNTPSAWHTKPGRPHWGNKHWSINTLVLLWGESSAEPPHPDSPFKQEEGILFADPPRRAHPSPRCYRNVSPPLCFDGVCLHLLASSKQEDRSPHLHYNTDKQCNASCQTRRHTKEEVSASWDIHRACLHQHAILFIYCSVVSHYHQQHCGEGC